MATYYARNVTGNWASNTSWDTVSSGGAGPAGPPVAGDTAIFDSGFTGNITVAAAAACLNITCAAGATGTLTFGSAYELTMGAGTIVFVSGFNLAGTGRLRFNGATMSLTTGGISIPNLRIGSTTITVTLEDSLGVTGTLTVDSTSTFAGAFSITCGTLVFFGSSAAAGITLSIVAGQTITVSTSMRLASALLTVAATIKSGTASSDAFLHFNGAAADCMVAGITFTDINCAHAIDNWYGGTLTRTTGITNVTSANLALASDAAKILTGQTVGGVNGSASAGGGLMINPGLYGGLR